MTGQDGIIEELFAQYQQQRSKLAQMRQELEEVSATAMSPRREVSVTVSHVGGLTDIKFTGSAYRRLAPQELSALIMATISNAKDQAAEMAAEIVAPVLPKGLNARDLMSGKLGAEALMPPDGPRMPQVVREQLERS